jgi:Protein of unknown function (DUF2971)
MSRIPKPPPPFLFRYRPPEEVTLGYFESLLRHNHIWASPPRGFTDLFDCRAQIDFNLSKKEMHQHWTQNFKMLGLKSMAASRKAKDILKTTNWQDPAGHVAIIQNFQMTLDNTGVICVTDTAIDRRMWDEYATGHRGLCLCFETSEEPFSLTREVNYLPELPRVKINADGNEKVKAFLLTKASPYSWEREWRFTDYDKGGEYKTISPMALRAVVFGSRTEDLIKLEVTRLLTSLRPDVMLLAVDEAGPDLCLKSVEESPASRINAPIQERVRSEPAPRPLPVRLLDYLNSVSPEHRRPNLDSRVEGLAVRLDDIFTAGLAGKRTQEEENSSAVALREATTLVREIVDRNGAATPGYGEVAVLLYGLVHAMVIKGGLPF